MGLFKSPARQDPLLALRFANYRNLAIARLILLTVFQMQTVTVGWELYERTRDALVLGGVGLIQILPIMAVTVLAGHFADQSQRKRIILLCGALMAVSALGLMLVSLYQAPIWMVYACLFLSGLARGFHKPATDALLWQYIPATAYTNAATWNSTVFQFSSVAGPAFGGLLIAALGGAFPVYALVTLATLVYLGLIGRLPDSRTALNSEPLSLRSLGAGFQFLRQHPVVLAAISLDLFAVLLGGAVTLLPVYAKEILHVGAAELGWMRAAPAIGALLMGAILVNLPPIQPAGKVLLGAVAGFGLVTIVFGLSQSLWLSIFMLVLTGALDNISVVIRHTLAQLWTPDHLRGRVSAINSVFISMSNELGGFESGLVAALVSPVFSVVSGGVGTIVVVIIVALLCPKMRHLQELKRSPEVA
jgi:MFS family permease